MNNAVLYNLTSSNPPPRKTIVTNNSPLLGADNEKIDANDEHFLKGKVAELRLELNSGGKKDKNHSAKKIALKKIVANMTMSNNDMVALFPDVVGCMQIPSLEIKKM